MSYVADKRQYARPGEMPGQPETLHEYFFDDEKIKVTCGMVGEQSGRSWWCQKFLMLIAFQKKMGPKCCKKTKKEKKQWYWLRQDKNMQNIF